MSHDEITAAEFAAYAQVKQDHIRYLRRRLRADREVEQYLAHQSARLGRPATMGEFERRIERIYAKWESRRRRIWLRVAGRFGF